MANPEWRFPSNDYGEIKGINDSGINTFKGTPIKSLAREICQNSLDAARDGRAEVEFSVFNIRQDEIPGANQLKASFNKCYEFWKKRKNKDCCDFFSNAIDIAQKDECVILRISDHLTTGLTGSRELINTNWTNLTKSSGVSDKKGASGGSFGIGKFATFACSDYACVFYSTYDENNECAFQGVARLVSFNSDTETITQGTGFYGDEKNTPIYEQLDLDSSYHRQKGDFGTDIYIVAFKYGDTDWKSELITSILDSFLVSIWEDNLNVRIDDDIINSGTLNDIIRGKYSKEISKLRIDKYYEVLESHNTKWISKSFFDYGEIRLGLLLNGEDLPQKISMVRKNGMKIKESRYKAHVPYIGICLLQGDKLNTRLRAMENPEHTKWEYQRLTNPQNGKKILQALDAFILDELGNLSAICLENSVDAVGVGDYIPDVSDNDNGSDKTEGVGDSIAEIEKIKVKGKKDFEEKIQYGNEKIMMHKELGSETDGYYHNGGKVKNPDPNNKKKVSIERGEDEYGSKRRMVHLNKRIAMCIDPKKGLYSLVISSMKSIDKCELEIMMSAESTSYPAEIKNAIKIPAQPLNYVNNHITNLSLQENKDLKIKLEINYNDYCLLEVSCYEITE